MVEGYVETSKDTIFESAGVQGNKALDSMAEACKDRLLIQCQKLPVKLEHDFGSVMVGYEETEEEREFQCKVTDALVAPQGFFEGLRRSGLIFRAQHHSYM